MIRKISVWVNTARLENIQMILKGTYSYYTVNFAQTARRFVL